MSHQTKLALKVAENVLINRVSAPNKGLSEPKPATAEPIHIPEKNATIKPPKITILSGPFVVHQFYFNGQYPQAISPGISFEKQQLLRTGTFINFDGFMPPVYS